MVKKVCRYNGQLVQVQWTFGQNHEIILSTVLAFDCNVVLGNYKTFIETLKLDCYVWQPAKISWFTCATWHTPLALSVSTNTISWDSVEFVVLIPTHGQALVHSSFSLFSLFSPF